MPIEIFELHIKANVNDNESGGKSSEGNDAGAGNKDEIVQYCVDKVLQILKDKEER